MLKARAGWFYYRKRIPRQLRPAFEGKHEIAVALETRDLGEAKVRVLRIAHEAGRPSSAPETSMGLVVNPASGQAWTPWRRRGALRFSG